MSDNFQYPLGPINTVAQRLQQLEERLDLIEGIVNKHEERTLKLAVQCDLLTGHLTTLAKAVEKHLTGPHDTDALSVMNQPR